VSDYFDAIDALIATSKPLPPPAERERLRKAHGLTQEQVGTALDVRRATVANWESGETEPRPPKREAYARLLDQLAELYPLPATPAAPAPPAAVAQPSAPAPVKTPAPARSDSDAPAAPRTVAARPAQPQARQPGRAREPLLVLDGDGTAYGAGGLVVDCPARTVAQTVEWALGEAGLGAARLHPAGKDADPLVVLTESAAARFGLPSRLEDRRSLRLPAQHPVVAELASAGWQLTKRGFGPWPRIYQPVEGGRRRCVQLAILPWDALDARTWGNAAGLSAPELAYVLGDFADRVLTPRGSAAVTGLELMTALHPPTRAARNTTGSWVSAPNPGSLTQPVDPAPPEAPDEHPLAQGRRTGQALDEEALDWYRDPEQLTDAECAMPFAVGVDINMAFAAACNGLRVGLGAPIHTTRPVFDKKTPGSWYVDLSHIPIDPRLPNPFTPTGQTPSGPAWYATPTVAYAQELGHDVQPIEAWLRPDSGRYLDDWYTRLRDAYLATMAELGVHPDMEPAEFLAAMDHHKETDPGQAMVLSAIKATVKGGIGKLRERPQGGGHKPGQRWPALERPTWRPDIRAAVISTARVNMHRKMRNMATKADRYPIAVLSDCVVYPAPGPSPLDILPYENGKPLPGGFRLGVNPGMVKHEGTQPFLTAAQLLDEGRNPARFIKSTDAVLDGE
jgi:DNA-binding XRE family transcriptional regulator